MNVCVRMCVYICVCVCVCEIWGSLVPAAEQSLFWWIQRRKKTWKEDRICHMKQVFSWISSSFCVFIPNCSLWSHLASSVGLGCFSVTISDWPTTRSKSCIRAPAPGASPVPFTSLCADSQAVSQICLSILTFILKQLLFPLSWSVHHLWSYVHRPPILC